MTKSRIRTPTNGASATPLRLLAATEARRRLALWNGLDSDKTGLFQSGDSRRSPGVSTYPIKLAHDQEKSDVLGSGAGSTNIQHVRSGPFPSPDRSFHPDQLPRPGRRDTAVIDASIALRAFIDSSTTVLNELENSCNPLIFSADAAFSTYPGRKEFSSRAASLSNYSSEALLGSFGAAELPQKTRQCLRHSKIVKLRQKLEATEEAVDLGKRSEYAALRYLDVSNPREKNVGPSTMPIFKSELVEEMAGPYKDQEEAITKLIGLCQTKDAQLKLLAKALRQSQTGAFLERIIELIIQNPTVLKAAAAAGGVPAEDILLAAKRFNAANCSNKMAPTPVIRDDYSQNMRVIEDLSSTTSPQVPMRGPILNPRENGVAHQFSASDVSAS